MPPSLAEIIAKATPKDVKLFVRHLATKPTPCDAVFAAPPSNPPEPTTCENHFLTVSIELPEEEKTEGSNGELFIFAVEVLVYSTARLTTVFVSKADSTGYTYQLKLPPTGRSLLKSVSTSFLSYVVQICQRSGTRLVLSLFARAQSQYIFPGSVENPHKHVLDDRALIKWWCRAVDPILRRNESESHGQDKSLIDASNGREPISKHEEETKNTSATAYLIVPGCDRLETRNFFPPTTRSDPPDCLRWLNSYPLHQICSSPDAPPRCLIPRFPDDPKARFLADLDEEVPDIAEHQKDHAHAGQWRSIRTLEQFWELMSFRQECSSGRLVGFLWVVVNPPGLATSALSPNQDENVSGKESSQSQESTQVYNNEDTATKDSVHNVVKDNTAPSEQEHGIILLSDENYQALMDHLLQLDFADEKIGTQSTVSWVSKLSSMTGNQEDRVVITGHEETVVETPSRQDTTSTIPKSNMLGAGLIKKRKKPTPLGDEGGAFTDKNGSTTPIENSSNENKNGGGQASQPVVNTLSGGVLRKKKKT